VKTGRVPCATAVAGESAAARNSNTPGPRLGPDPHEAAKFPPRTVMGASIDEPRSDHGIGKEPTVPYALMQRSLR
jgi:hypothetical protein